LLPLSFIFKQFFDFFRLLSPKATNIIARGEANDMSATPGYDAPIYAVAESDEHYSRLSIPHISLVVFDFIFIQQRPKFIFKILFRMMFLLPPDISRNRRDLRLADRKRSVSFLPIKICVF
jgi:hypothetical protein